ncbi:hypothetical protein FNF29_01158 [Cafeteria roenbergensis]|uniref:Nucleotide exchange factor Fes1 domain-containing protein n=1 Tax=Cafeteria roenbergensis TaxID=33653 RepID=A0A5A8CTB2_CAFRO|nr:hypothetical protein FNF29_01158 [Cafeteria roenbergensis]|eukprot:KAA0156365.1 hypothetical protein FNF29_01158 [Cafeteria roenbergensis]
MDPGLNAVFQWIIKETASKSDGTEPSKFSAMPEDEKKWLLEAIQSMTVDEAAELKKAVAALDDKDASVEDLVANMEGVRDMCDNLDMALVLGKLGGMVRLVELTRHEDSRVRTLAADTIGVSVQNDAPAQQSAAAAGALQALVRMVNDTATRCAETSPEASSGSPVGAAAADNATEELNKALLALASLVRGNDGLTASLVSGGYNPAASSDTPMLMLAGPAGAAAPVAPAAASGAAAVPTLPAGPQLLANAFSACGALSTKVQTRILFLLQYLLEGPGRLQAAASSHFGSLASAERTSAHGLVRLCAREISPVLLEEDAPPYLLLRLLTVGHHLARAALEAVLTRKSAAVADLPEHLPCDDAEGLEAMRTAADSVLEAAKGLSTDRAACLEEEVAAARSLVSAVDSFLKVAH